MAEYLRVSVVYVGAAEQFQKGIEAPLGISVEEAIRQSGVLGRCREIDLGVNKVGIFGKVVALDQILADGDRVEIYPPLIADPKEARKRRAAEGQAS